jgi:hypothetical protein
LLAQVSRKEPWRRVKINFARSAEHVETDISLQQLREAAEGHYSGPVLGVYVGTLRYGIEIDDTIRQLASNLFCATRPELTNGQFL